MQIWEILSFARMVDYLFVFIHLQICSFHLQWMKSRWSEQDCGQKPMSFGWSDDGKPFFTGSITSRACILA
jgi:hypothetical protein